MSDINITVNDEIVNIDVIDEPVLVNVVNSPGQQGPAGPGVPVGGTAGQILAKASATNYDTEWINNYAKYLATNVRNQTGSTIGAFQVVYISGATGNKPLISLADADTEVTSSKTYGVTATAIANNGTGDVVTAGELSGIDTSAFNEGDLLWLSTTAGGVVTTPPAEPAHAVFIGYVVRSHPTLGVIDVSIQNGYELNELHGVQITNPTDNQGLFYNSTSTLWENKSITTALGYTPVPTTRNITINGVTYDLSADRTWTIAAGISGSGASGQVTYWTGASAVSGSNNLFWDATNNGLVVGSNTISSFFRLGVNGNIVVSGASPYITFNTATNSGTTPAYIQYVNSTNLLNIISTGAIDFYTNANQRMRLFAGGNVLIGSTTDLGVRFGVIGDTLLRGSGNTSATTALTVQNSSSINMIQVLNNGYIRVGSTARFYSSSVASAGDVDLAGELFTINSRNFNTPTNQQNGDVLFNGVTILDTSGIHNGVSLSRSFTPTSGTSIFNHLALNTVINQTGGANGITRGLYVNPTLTAAADFRAIETSAGNVLFGSNFFWDNTNGRLGIGTNAPVSDLQINKNVNGAVRLRIDNTSTGGDAVADIYVRNSVGGAVFQITGTGNTIPNVTANQARFRTDSAVTNGFSFITGTTAPITFATNDIVAMTIFGSTRNVGIGFNTDPAVRLGVSGDTLLRGSGSTSATTALTVQNSSSTNLFTVRNDGNTIVGTGTPTSAYLRGLVVSGTTGDINSSVFNSSTTGTTGITLGQSNTIYAAFVKWGSTYSGNYPASSIPLANSSQFQSGSTNNLPLIIQGTPIIFNAGNTTTNIAGRLSTVSFRFTTLANAHTDGTALVDLDASTTSYASLRIRSGVAPTTPNDGDIWFDGTDIKMRIGGVTKTFTLI